MLFYLILNFVFLNNSSTRRQWAERKISHLAHSEVEDLMISWKIPTGITVLLPLLFLVSFLKSLGSSFGFIFFHFFK